MIQCALDAHAGLSTPLRPYPIYKCQAKLKQLRILQPDRSHDVAGARKPHQPLPYKNARA